MTDDTTDLFTPLELRNTTARNRVMVSPMCQYSCDDDGLATDWHHVHLGSRAVGGAGIVMAEATAVSPEGRITPHDLGIWTDAHGEALADTAAFVRDHGALAGIQLAHAGRKASTERPADGGGPIHDDQGWTTVAPSAEPWPHDAEEGGPVPTERLDAEGIQGVIDDFRAAAERALEAGFQVAEVHGAHGYLLHEFCSPVTNHRDDDYGGDFAGRTRLVREVTRAVREVWPDDRPVFVRLSATDWLGEDAWTVADTARLAPLLAEDGADLVDVSAGAVDPSQDVPGLGPHYQVPYAEQVRESLREADADCTVGAVGGITTPEGADELVRNDRADLAIMAREHIRDPYFTLTAAQELDALDRVDVPRQYYRGFPH
ncbi:NADH:flavin oxidoreductase/NADH oxidase [Haloglomus salinum]|uniref:NADH:flavin oxidoreductase/NADH oxidase n=1 Tax=Haloglomus salinum TaxID=2962673 RepID=UPI0020C9D916|nr:NADH:flavin oxidoreductase/NADH oxidase [Haloglomus salinum]